MPLEKASLKLDTGLELTDFSTKWGLVTVVTKDGLIDREYVITAEEAEAVHKGNNVLPPGCTKEEWASGCVYVASRPCNVGQAVQNPDGTLVVNYGVTVTDKSVEVNLMRMEPTEWEHTEGKLKLEASLAPVLDVSKVEVVTLKR